MREGIGHRRLLLQVAERLAEPTHPGVRRNTGIHGSEPRLGKFRATQFAENREVKKVHHAQNQ